MNEEFSPTQNRRDFLKNTAVVAGITVLIRLNVLQGAMRVSMLV